MMDVTAEISAYNYALEQSKMYLKEIYKINPSMTPLSLNESYQESLYFKELCDHYAMYFISPNLIDSGDSFLHFS